MIDSENPKDDFPYYRTQVESLSNDLRRLVRISMMYVYTPLL